MEAVIAAALGVCGGAAEVQSETGHFHFIRGLPGEIESLVEMLVFFRAPPRHNWNYTRVT